MNTNYNNENNYVFSGIKFKENALVRFIKKVASKMKNNNNENTFVINKTSDSYQYFISEFRNDGQFYNYDYIVSIDNDSRFRK